MKKQVGQGGSAEGSPRGGRARGGERRGDGASDREIPRWVITAAGCHWPPSPMATKYQRVSE